MITKKFKDTTPLIDVMNELEKDGLIEITKVFKEDGEWVFEYEVEK